jgi:hypothetical protein
MTPCVAAYVSRGWFLPVQLLRDVSPASREPLRAAAYGFHAGDTSVLPWSCRVIYPPAHLLQTSTSRRQQPASQATTNRVSRQTDGNPAAAPPDEAAPTEPHRYNPRPSLPRRRVGQLQVAGDGAAAALKGVPPCSSQVLPPAEPGSGRVAPSTNRAAYTWRVVGESAYSASIRCSVVRPSQQARFSHPPPRWPTEDGAPTWERESRTCRRGSQGAQGEQGARGVTDGSRACGRAGSPAVRRRGAASPLPPPRRHRSGRSSSTRRVVYRRSRRGPRRVARRRGAEVAHTASRAPPERP